MAREVLWRQEDPVLDSQRHVIKGGMFPFQRAWWRSSAFIKAFVGGYGSGKTLISSKRAIAQCLLNGPIPYAYVSPTFRIAKRTAIPTIKALLNGKATLDSGLQWVFNKVDLEFTIWHRGRVGHLWVASGEDPESLKGPNLCGANIDEPFSQDREVLEQMLARVRHPGAKNLEITLTGTPEELNWGYDICEGEDRDRYDIEVIHARTEDNKTLHPSYAERMRRAYSDKQAEAYVSGKFVSLSKGLVYYAFSKDLNVCEVPDDGGPIGVGMDFNVNPMALVLFRRRGNHVHVFEEMELENADTEYACDLLLGREDLKFKAGPRQGLSRVEAVYPDPTGRSRHTSSPGGKTDIYYIKQAGFDVQAHPSSPKIRDRENSVNAKFKPNVDARGQGPTLTVSSKCRKLIHYLSAYSHEKKNKQKAMSHMLDALGYPIEYLFPLYIPSQVVRLEGH